MADIRRLPTPVSDLWDWQLHGACRGMDSETFFHPDGERGPTRVNREARAQQVCRTCVVLEPCRAHALAVHEPYGVWGGLTESDRSDILRRPNRTLRVPSTISQPDTDGHESRSRSGQAAQLRRLCRVDSNL